MMRTETMEWWSKMKKVALFAFAAIPGILAFSNTLYAAGNTIIEDAKHYSNVLGEIRNYRIFLPQDYYDEPLKEYSVIYFYHGWSQRYFGSLKREVGDGDGPTDEDKIAEMVSKYQVIVVKPDGYNANPEDTYYLRPYNIGPVETHRQFPLYFPELVDYIDAKYRTIAKRENRAISGLSMGGFMAFWIAGKFPHLLSAAGSFCGSPEFVVGPRDFPVEYYHRDMYKNYEALKLRLNYGDDDFIRAYHRDINRVWLPILNNYETQEYPGSHDIVGLDDMFRFMVDVFNHPVEKPKQWNHIEVYPTFSVWDYTIRSDRDVPGFTILENVDKNGFKISVRKVLPEGETLPMVKLSVLTAPLYKKNMEYLIHVVDIPQGHKFQKMIKSDGMGRLRIELNGGLQEIGITEPDGKPNIAIASLEIGSESLAGPGIDNSLYLQLINKGGSRAVGVTARLKPFGSAADIKSNSIDFGNIEVTAITSSSKPFVFSVSSDSLKVQRFELEVTDTNNNQWQQFVVVDLKAQDKKFNNFEIADGRTVTYAKGGMDTVTTQLGKGNGDGIPNPGESIAILVNHEGLLRLTSLYSLNKHIDLKSSHTRVSDSWTDFDHVGATFKYNIPVISSDSPQGASIDLHAEYWLPDYPEHIIKSGKITIKIEGKDETAPQLDWFKINGDNIFQVRFFDGGKISHAEVTIRGEEGPGTEVKFKLNDEGLEGDKAVGDQVFSQMLTVPIFALYQAEIKVRDHLGNEANYKIPESFILHGARANHK